MVKLKKFIGLILSLFYINFSHAVTPFVTTMGGYRMPSIGYGTFTIMNETELSIALNEALRVGYRHIDTAAFYYNEHVVGAVLDEWFSSGKLKREDVFVTTKLHLKDEYPNKVDAALKKCLDNLKLEYVDLFLVHFPVALEPIENGRYKHMPTDLIGVWKKMEEQVDLGLTKMIGVSNFNISQMDRILDVARIQPACNQIELHPYYQQKEMRQYCKEKNIVVVSYSSLGAPGVNNFFGGFGWNLLTLPPILNDPVLERIATKHNKRPAQVILRYLNQIDIVVIPKSTNLKRIKENFDIFDFELDDDDIKAIEKLDKGIKAKIFNFKFLDPDIIHNSEYPLTDLIAT